MTITSKPVLHVSPQLSIGDAKRVAAWFLHRGGGDNWRAELMADMPLVYARVYPGVDPEAILRNVRAGLERIAQEQADAFAALAGKHAAYAGREHAGHFHDPESRYDYCADPACPRLRASQAAHASDCGLQGSGLNKRCTCALADQDGVADDPHMRNCAYCGSNIRQGNGTWHDLTLENIHSPDKAAGCPESPDGTHSPES